MLTAIIIFCAKYLIFIALVLAGLFFLRQNRATQKRMVFFAIASLGLTLVLATIAGWIFYDPRPFVAGHFTPLIPHAADNGFPSDHTLLTSAVGFLVFVFHRRWGLLLLLLAAVIGVARILAGIHSPIDIVGSFLMSIVATGTVYGIARYRLIRCANNTWNH